MQFSTLHRDDDRHVWLTQAEGAAIVFDPGTAAWIVRDPAQIETVLRHPDVRAATIESAVSYEEIQRRYGRSFPNMLFAFRYLPLCGEGDWHRTLRRRLGEIVAEKRAAVTAALPQFVDEKLSVIGGDRPIELMSEIVAPLVDAVTGLLTGIPVTDPEKLSGISVAFDRMTGPARRKEIEHQLGETRAMIRRALGAGASEDREGDCLTLFILGRHATIGTLGESLYRILSESRGSPLSPGLFPQVPMETGVPYVERYATEALDLGGVRIERGQRIRLMLQSIAYSDEASGRARMFGMGAHACLGRQISLDLWGCLARKLGETAMTAEIVEHTMRRSDFVFTCPERLVVRFRSPVSSAGVAAN